MYYSLRIYFLALQLGLTCFYGLSQDSISLAGKWKIKIDRNNVGIKEKWYTQEFKDSITLPSSMQYRSYGDKVNSQTNWLGKPIDNFFKKSKYAVYRKDNNFKFPFWLTPTHYYQGISWYQKEINIPQKWIGQHLMLSIERCHWATTVFFDNRLVGSDSSLSTPHNTDLGLVILPGKHLLSIRVDNSYLLDIGQNSNAISDQTQGTWNGIVGKLTLKPVSQVYISNIKVYPDIKNKKASIQILLKNTTDKKLKGEVRALINSINDTLFVNQGALTTNYNFRDTSTLSIDYPMGDSILLWDEFKPNLYQLKVYIESKNERYSDSSIVKFGMREITYENKFLLINSKRRFLRGTTNCASFPSTGFPPVDTSDWERIISKIKSFGLNHICFSSWCPPKAAFDAADRYGIYCQVEICDNANPGVNEPLDTFIYTETRRIINEYGNHPSFCFMVPCNEPVINEKSSDYFNKYIEYWTNKDNRRLYSAGIGLPFIKNNNFKLISQTEIRNLSDNESSEPGSFNTDYDLIINQSNTPVIFHEAGQWSAYPNIPDTTKYTGLLRAKNYSIYNDFLIQNNIEKQLQQFILASGKLQAICYKSEIESYLKTSNLSGFQLFSLSDYPGQGGAPVGMVDIFYNNKPYITTEKFTQFCNSIVPLTDIQKYTWRSTETFETPISVANYFQQLQATHISWEISDENENTFAQNNFTSDLQLGLNKNIGKLSLHLNAITKPLKLTITVTINNKYSNSWNIWVYPKTLTDFIPNKAIITDTLTTSITTKLINGASVLLVLNGKIKQGKGREIKISFPTITRNSEYSKNTGSQTMGILCNPSHPIFKEFPTDFYSNLQWIDILNTSQTMIFKDFPNELIPVIQIIDDWYEARKLGLLIEAKVGKGKIIVTTIDLFANTIASQQLHKGILNYMNSSNFNPQVSVNFGLIKSLYE